MTTRVHRPATPIAVDADGYLRRECPSCEREFKRIVAGSTANKESASNWFFCPYCGFEAQASRWLTKAQVACTKNIVANHAEQRTSHVGFKSLNFAAMRDRSDVAHETMTESNDMAVVHMTCHPNESIKIYEKWIGTVRCPVCAVPHTLY